jgi:hypothetical protein
VAGTHEYRLAQSSALRTSTIIRRLVPILEFGQGSTPQGSPDRVRRRRHGPEQSGNLRVRRSSRVV